MQDAAGRSSVTLKVTVGAAEESPQPTRIRISWNVDVRPRDESICLPACGLVAEQHIRSRTMAFRARRCQRENQVFLERSEADDQLGQGRSDGQF